MTLTSDDLRAIRDMIRQIVREELAAAKHNDDLMNDEAYLVATTTPQQRNAMARAQRAAQVAAQKAAGEQRALNVAKKKTCSFKMEGAAAAPDEGDIGTVASLPETGFIRLPVILELIPVSASKWWKGVRKGEYPAGIKLSARCTAWKAEDIQALIKRLGG